MTVFPAISADALLQAFAAVGLDAASLRRTCGLTGDLTAPDARLPEGAWEDLWRAAQAVAPRPALPTEAGLAIPFGAFGAVDYLVGSAATVGGALHALADHFASLASAVRLECVEGDRVVEVRVVPVGRRRPDTDEFTVAALVGRFAALSQSPFAPLSVSLTRAPVAGPHAALLKAPVSFGASVARLDLPRTAMDAPMRSADPSLHRVLSQLATRLGLGSAAAGETPLDLAIRGRLRDLLPQGRASADVIARSLGLSERTLHRRLAEGGRSLGDLLDRFRAEEAERLLLDGQVPLHDLARALGYGDASAFARAFRRWKGTSPTAWVRRRRGASAGGDPA